MSFIQALRAFTSRLDEAGFPYAIGGSVASSVHGLARTTMDIDTVVGMSPEDVARFIVALGPDFYVDDAGAENAFRYGRGFNIIYQPYIFKIDIFPVAPSHPELKRRVGASTDAFGEPVEFSVVSPEDIILAKLSWYAKGGRNSEQQWSDILGVLKLQSNKLDWTYLDGEAAKRGVLELLNNAKLS